MIQRVARDEGVALAQVNMVGGNDELIFDGHSAVLDAKGGVLALGASFEEEILIADVDAWADAGSPPILPSNPEEQLFRALVLGVRDYVRKCGFKEAVIGLSGGIDSAVVAVVAQAALGAEKVWGVAMPSKHSSKGSLTDAEQLAKQLGIRYSVLPIADPVNKIEAVLAPVFEGRVPDLTEENIQSRTRALLLMAISNKFGPLVLTTGNKSEMAVGYCTLYGDNVRGAGPSSPTS